MLFSATVSFCVHGCCGIQWHYIVCMADVMSIVTSFWGHGGYNGEWRRHFVCVLINVQCTFFCVHSWSRSDHEHGYECCNVQQRHIFLILYFYFCSDVMFSDHIMLCKFWYNVHWHHFVYAVRSYSVTSFFEYCDEFLINIMPVCIVMFCVHGAQWQLLVLWCT